MNAKFRKNESHGHILQRLRAPVVVAVGLLVLTSARADTVIVQDTFYYDGWLERITNTVPDIANLPSNAWVAVGRWGWEDPFIPGSGWNWWPQHTAYLEHVLTSISIALGDYNTGRLRLSADVAIANLSAVEGVALGFRSTAPAHGIEFGTDPRLAFTGLRVNGEGVITLVVNGVAQPGTASVGSLTDQHYYPFSYDVDTASGDVFNIQFNGSYVPDFTTDGFTEAATEHASFMTGEGASGAVDNFTVTSIDPASAPPVVDNANGATSVAGTGATLNGTLISGGPADVYICYGTDPDNWSHTNSLGSCQDGLFSTSISGLSLSTVYYYRAFASNAFGSAWAAAATNFLSGAQSYTWTGLAGNGCWNDAANWDPDTGFPNNARETAVFACSDATPNTTVHLNQPIITVGEIRMTPGATPSTGFTIAANGEGQALVLDNGAEPACLRVLGGAAAGGAISAPVVLNSDVEVYTLTAGNNYALTFQGPVAGPGGIIAKSGRIGFDPLVDTTYAISLTGIKSGGALWKRGTKTATFTGSSSVRLSGDQNGIGTIGEGGALVVSGGTFTNPSTSGPKNLFSTAGANALVVTNGGQLVYTTDDSSYKAVNFRAADNTVVVSGEGSWLNLNNSGIRLDSSGGRLVVAEGAQVTGGLGHIGWFSSNNTVLIAGANSLWDLNNASLCMGVGSSAASNALIIADGGIVRNAFLWMGYSYWNEGGGSYNRLVVTNGGKFLSGKGDDWGWGSCVGVSGQGDPSNPVYKAHDNTALVAGEGSLWDLQERNLCIGLVNHSMDTGGWNRVSAEAGGVITNVNTLHVGRTLRDGTPQGVSIGNALAVADGGAVSASSVVVGDVNATGNAVVLDGGSLNTAALAVSAGNSIAPVIDEDGLAPITVSGTATFEAGSLVCPTPLKDSPLGVYTLVVADAIVDNGLALDPAANEDSWRLVVDETSVVLKHMLPNTLVILH
ncbi:MAG: hypothetical protein ACOX9C_06410 [Kiritimatiellia bacterium]|jgi:hypothetical protein